jgi:V-type H+-transporting ATPase subunit a
MGQLVPSHADTYPTHFQTNDFTRSAQEIVETYGVANYQEANPAYFTCITFPFLFGVMFGDIGHGLIVFAFSLFLIFQVKEDTSNVVFKMLRPHRYIVCLMGFFAIYCGFIYNDYLSISLNLFGSCYNPEGIQEKSPIPRAENCIYPFGLDPVWSVA